LRCGWACRDRCEERGCALGQSARAGLAPTSRPAVLTRTPRGTLLRTDSTRYWDFWHSRRMRALPVTRRRAMRDYPAIGSLLMPPSGRGVLAYVVTDDWHRGVDLLRHTMRDRDRAELAAIDGRTCQRHHALHELNTPHQSRHSWRAQRGRLPTAQATRDEPPGRWRFRLRG
jgi:hypothetical protein